MRRHSRHARCPSTWTQNGLDSDSFLSLQSFQSILVQPNWPWNINITQGPTLRTKRNRHVQLNDKKRTNTTYLQCLQTWNSKMGAWFDVEHRRVDIGFLYLLQPAKTISAPNPVSKLWCLILIGGLNCGCAWLVSIAAVSTSETFLPKRIETQILPASRARYLGYMSDRHTFDRFWNSLYPSLVYRSCIILFLVQTKEGSRRNTFNASTSTSAGSACDLFCSCGPSLRYQVLRSVSWKRYGKVRVDSHSDMLQVFHWPVLAWLRWTIDMGPVR